MSRLLAKLFGLTKSASPSVPLPEEGIARQLLLGKIAPPTDFMRSPKLDAAVETYREIVGRQERRAS